MNYVKLNNGIEMPQMGYGVYQVSSQECEQCVSDALSVGYRMIDTAQAYHNEEGVGNAVKKSGIDRKEIFLVSKVWISNYGYEKAKASIDESLRKLQTDYIDLMLLHQPFCDRYGAYRALQDAYREGKLRAIGVSNFYPDHFIVLAFQRKQRDPVFPHEPVQIRPRRIDALAPDVLPAVEHIVQDLNAQMGHADLIYVRETHTETDVHPGRIFDHGVHLPADVAGGLLNG